MESHQKAPLQQKCNTTSSVFSKNTISSPNSKAIIMSMSHVILSQINDDLEQQKKVPKNDSAKYFDEERYIKLNPEKFGEKRLKLLRSVPTQEQIFEFIDSIFQYAEFSLESCIVSLIYLYRFTQYIQYPLYPTTWRPILFTSLLISQKVIDDDCLRNKDFLAIYPFWDIKECNKLEINFLKVINFEVTTSLKLYAKYYFELRSIINKEEDFSLQPITIQQAEFLENNQKHYKENEQMKELIQNTKSLDYQEPKSKALTILD